MDLNFKEFGTGEPLVILHGLFGTLDNWQTIARQLSDEFTVYIVDLPNHGRSPHTKGEFDYSEMSDAVAEFLTKNWIHETRLIGHSMGGKLAMQLALHQPDLIKRLAVIDIAPKQYTGGHGNIFKALFALDLDTLTDRKEAEQFLTEHLPEEGAGTIQFLLKNLSRRSDAEGGGFEWKMNLDVLYANYPRILDKLEGDTPFRKPTLFIRGGESNYIRHSDFDIIAALFPNSAVQTIEGAGHWVHAEKPTELLAALRQFMIG
jgi:esterase